MSGQWYKNKQVSIGDDVGTVSKKGYHRVILEGKGFIVHRIIWEMLVGKLQPNIQIDHINNVKGDNRLANLRTVTNAVNKRNSGKYKSNTSGVTGVRKIVMGTTLYWSAHWADINTKSCGAYYSTIKFGYEEALKMACERRIKEIAKLNEQGAGYSDTHGVEYSTGKKACTEATEHNVPAATN